MKFIDRQNELARLQSEYDSYRSALVILYGRRRVGKTALISEFIKTKPSLYILLTEESEEQNRAAFQMAVADYLDNDLIRSSRDISWEILFDTLTKNKQKQKLVLVLDEFQYIGKSNPAFPSVFQKIWDTVLKSRNVMVVLCGSLITMMESQTLNYSSPLYGRRTAQLKLKQIPFRYYGRFYPGMSTRDLVERYAITGGVPKYIEQCMEEKDFYKMIEKNILDTTGLLYEEPAFLLRGEVSEVGSYYSIIKTIALGHQKLSKIAMALEVAQTNLTKYLKVLMDLDILEREVPVTEDKPDKSKKGLYKIKDNYLRFWFRFIYPYRSYLERGNTEHVLNIIRKNLAESHTAYVFEDICREKLWELNEEGAWNFALAKVGRFWDNNDHEIDAVALDENGENLILGECKYHSKPIGADVLQELEAKAAYITLKKKPKKTWYILFSSCGFKPDLKKMASTRLDLQLVDMK